MVTIEEMFAEFMEQADTEFLKSEETKLMLKALYYTAIGHFLMTNTEFILEEKSPKKLIKHIQLVDEVHEYMTQLKHEHFKDKPYNPHSPH